MHFPVGAAAAAMYYLSEYVPLGAAILASSIMVLYEFLNEWGKHDQSYRDLIGMAFGIWVCIGVWSLVDALI
ncbi:MAG: hypothetical protein KKF27_21090 [Gammaproteobacteria bacterium]|nr:hypothetical protein [Gammaproteobacteria bacterium]MBU2685744.1 hypothetical protein [Gammaproteobacteria bacterium]